MDEKTKQLILDYQNIFSGDAGKRVKDDLAERFHYNAIFELIIKTGPPEQTAFELGKRDAYLYILDKLTADPNEEQQTVAETG